MLARTKKRRIDKHIVLTFQGPEVNRERAIEVLHIPKIITMKQSGWLTMGMVLLLCFGVGPGFADSMQQGESYWINPAWQDRITLKDLVPGKTPKQESAALVCYSEEEVAALLKVMFADRATAFSFDMIFTFTFGEAGDILARAEAAAVAGDDYLVFSILGRHRNWGGFPGEVTVNYTDIQYVASAEQEQQVDARVDEILAAILQPGLNHEEQLKAIHDWIVLNVEYDLTYQEYSAWAALFLGHAVCQGYSLLACKMLQVAGIPVRIINSTAMSHAWNMVYLCGYWYHLDVTWNDPVPDVPGRVLYSYYNLSDQEISGEAPPHYGWSTDAPEAPIPYVAGICADLPAVVFTLEDVIMILQICTNVAVAHANSMDLDANGDGQVSLEDALYILRNIADDTVMDILH